MNTFSNPEHYICTVNPNGASLTSLTISILKKLHQGTNASKVILEAYAFFVLQCTVFGRKSKHKLRGISKPDIESIFTKIIFEIVWS